MTKFANLSLLKRTAILSGLIVAALLVGALIGYFRGLHGDGGNVDRAIDWAVKTDLLCILFIIVSVVFGRIEAYLESEWQLRFVPGFAILMGFVLAIADGANVLLGMNSSKFWTTTLSGFIQGVFGGGLGAILIQLTDKKNMAENSTKAESDM